MWSWQCTSLSWWLTRGIWRYRQVRWSGSTKSWRAQPSTRRRRRCLPKVATWSRPGSPSASRSPSLPTLQHGSSWPPTWVATRTRPCNNSPAYRRTERRRTVSAIVRREPETTLDAAPVLVFSADSHIGPRKADLRPYCPKKYLDEFDDFYESVEALTPMFEEMAKKGASEEAFNGRRRNLGTAGHYDPHARLRDYDR